MASRDGNEGELKLLHDGHTIVYSPWLTNFAGSLPLCLDWSFTFACSASTTSWKLQATFERDPKTGGVSCTVTFKRTDDRKIEVTVEYSIKAFPPLKNVCIDSRTRRQPNILPNSIVKKKAYDFIPCEVLKQLGDRHILFQVSFTVSDCHDRDTLRTARDPQVVKGRRNQMLRSKF